MEHAVFDTAAPRVTSFEVREVDRSLPEWARRSNPIVRRHLGEYWKTMSLDALLVLRIFIGNCIFVLLSLPMPFLLTLVMPTVMVSLVLLPIGFIMYAQSLLLIGTVAAVLVADERRNRSLDLLRACPRPLQQVIYSKIAAAVWRQLENLSLIITAAALLSLPLLVIQYDMLISMSQQAILMRLALVLALAASVIRIFLEVVLIGSIGALVGAATPLRAPAILTTTLLTGAYFALINLVRLLDVELAMRLFIEIALPLLLPLLLIPICLRLTVYLLTRDA